MYFSSDKKLGILGGGQLGKMLLYHTRQWDVYTKVLDPDPEAPARLACNTFVQGSLTDFDTVYQFGKDCDILTIEIEHVNTEALKALKKEGKIVHPNPDTLEMIKDKGLQKLFYREHDFPTSNFQICASKEDIVRKIEEGHIAYPFVQKTRTDGYDGRGVVLIQNMSDNDKLFDAPSLIEELVDIQEEIAVLAARNEKGEIKVYLPVSMEFNPEANLLDLLLFPADLPVDISKKAMGLAESLIESFDICGLLAVEFFVTAQNDVLVNEVAPRPHNSGHQTIESCVCNQYEQHLRGILNLPLGNPSCILPSAMINLLGAEGFTGDVLYTGVEECLKEKGVHVHIYGKRQTKPFRKMGHVTVTDIHIDHAKQKALWVKNQMQVQCHR